MLAKEPDKPDPKAPESPAAPPAPPRKPIDDKMVAQLREAARRRRPWPLATWLLALLIFGVPVGLLVWAFWPRAEPPQLMVTAFDQVVRQGEPAVCRAQLEPVERERAGLDLTGQDLTFEERTLLPPKGRQPGVAKTAANAAGSASVQWAFPTARRFEFTARYVQPDRLTESIDRGRVFSWPKEKKCLLVDVATLAEEGEKLWQQETVPDAALLPDAVKALQSAPRAKFAVVYLALEPRRGVVYRQVRNWVERNGVPPQTGIPDGPVLGRLSFAGSGDAQNVLALFKRFDGPLVVIVRQAEAGEAYRAAGVRTLTVGPGGQGWKDVEKELAK
jgi:hypothetical protein